MKKQWKNVREISGVFPIIDAITNNLKHLSVDIPLGILVTFTGVMSFGKVH